MGRVGEDNESPSYGSGSHQNQQQPRSTHHPQHQHAEAYPPYQQDDYEPAAFPPPPDKAHAFPPPQPDHHQPPPASFPPNQPQQQPQPPQFNGGNMHAGMPPPMGMPINGGSPFNNPAFNQMPIPPHQSPMVNNGFSTEPWKTSLFDCFEDPENALITFCFPCVTFGQIAEIVDQGTSNCGSSGFMYTLISFCIAMPCLLSCTYRTKLRNRFRLVESPGPDWIIHCFCECCALCQEYRELKQRGYDPSVGWLGNAARMGMVSPGIAMQAPVQPMMGR